MKFVNRKKELAELDRLSKKAGLGVFFGRRRVGKTRMLSRWCKKNNAAYTQSIEAASSLQITQVFDDIKKHLNMTVKPMTWAELFELFDLSTNDMKICIDEFPYLVESDPSLPSVFQKWLDHRKNKRIFIIVSGSSQKMMHGIFLNINAPLYGRAEKNILIEPMDYLSFCRACGLDTKSIESFVRFSMVGGIPKYWEFVEPGIDVVALAESLYFGYAPYMENEPFRLLADEKINGIIPVNLLEVIGRGSHKPSEMASRLEIPQTNLSRPLKLLSDMSIIKRDMPFGESTRTSKKVLYSISDPSIRFWFNVFSPHRSLWSSYSNPQKKRLLFEHASTVYEDHIRQKLVNASRYWESDIEFDAVNMQQDKLVVSEIKFKYLTNKEKKLLLGKLNESFLRTKLANKYKNVKFRIYDVGDL